MTIERAPDLRRFIARQAGELPRICSKITAERADELRRQGRDVLSLLPYPHLPLPDHLLEAVARAARENRSVPGTGSLGLRAAIAGKLERETGWRLDPTREIVITNGAMQALNIVFRALLDPGDEVIFPIPSYFFYGGVQLARGVPVMIPLDEAAGWGWDLAAIERAITSRTKLLVLHSPTNPTGNVLALEVLGHLVEIARRHDLLLLYDESYDRLVYDGRRHHSPAEIEEARDRLIVIQSVTKSYAMSPWRIGYVAAPTVIADQLGKLIEWEVLMCSHVGQAAAEAAISGPADWRLDIPRRFAEQRDVIHTALRDVPGVSVRKPEGGPFLFPNVSGLGLAGDDFWRILLDEYGVPTEPGSFFKSGHHVRLSFGAAPSVLEEAGRRIRAAADSVRERFASTAGVKASYR